MDQSDQSLQPPDGAEDTFRLGSDFKTSAKPGFNGNGADDPDKNIRMDIDPLSSSGALDALDSLYDTGGMQFPIEGMEGRRRDVSSAKTGRWGAKRKRKEHRKDKVEGSFFSRHKRSIIVAAVAVAAIAIAVIAFFAILFGRTNAISDSAIRQVLENDEAFMKGSASDLFVEPEPYVLQGMTVDGRDAWGDGLVVHATAELKNTYFLETRKVTISFPYAGVTDGYGISVESHGVRAVRGISNDPEYGITGVNPTFDEAAQTCSLSQSFEADTSLHWWYSEAGDISLAYAFSDDTWNRTAADAGGLSTSFQYLVGSYGDVTGGSQGGFTSFEIKDVDDATGEISGTFSWTDGTQGWFGYGTVKGTFSGYVRKDGSIEATATERANTLSFAGRLGDAQTMSIAGTVYYDTTASAFGMGDVAQSSFGDTTLEKGAATAVSKSSEAPSPSPRDDRYSEQIPDLGGSEDWWYFL